MHDNTNNSSWLNLLENNTVNKGTAETIATTLETTTNRDFSGGYFMNRIRRFADGLYLLSKRLLFTIISSKQFY